MWLLEFWLPYCLSSYLLILKRRQWKIAQVLRLLPPCKRPKWNYCPSPDCWGHVRSKPGGGISFLMFPSLCDSQINKSLEGENKVICVKKWAFQISVALHCFMKFFVLLDKVPSYTQIRSGFFYSHNYVVIVHNGKKFWLNYFIPVS